MVRITVIIACGGNSYRLNYQLAKWSRFIWTLQTFIVDLVSVSSFFPCLRVSSSPSLSPSPSPFLSPSLPLPPRFHLCPYFRLRLRFRPWFRLRLRPCFCPHFCLCLRSFFVPISFPILVLVFISVILNYLRSHVYPCQRFGQRQWKPRWLWASKHVPPCWHGLGEQRSISGCKKAEDKSIPSRSVLSCPTYWSCSAHECNISIIYVFHHVHYYWLLCSH